MKSIRSHVRLASLTAFASVGTAFAGCSEDATPERSSTETLGRVSQALPGDGLVISQVSIERGVYNRRFIELFNRSTEPVSLDGLSVQNAGFASGTLGTTAESRIALPNVTVPAGGYYLIGVGTAAGNGDAFVPDLDVAADPSLGSIDKIAIVRGVDEAGCGRTGNRCSAAVVADLIGYNPEGSFSLASDYEGTRAIAPDPSTHVSLGRRQGGCQDTNNNRADFSEMATAPRSSASPLHDCSVPVDAGADAGEPADAGAAAAKGLVISQVQGGASTFQARYKRNFIELYNRSNAPISLAGLSVQVQSATRTFDDTGSLRTVALPDATVPPGGYYLIGANASVATNGLDLPAVDLDTPPTFVILASESGKVAIARGTAPLSCGTSANRCPPDRIVDLVGYGRPTTNDYEGSGVAIGATRRNGGCRDTDDNASDFVDYFTAPAVARSSASPVRPCPTTAGEGLVISQVYGNGGRAGALYARPFVELFNRSGVPISLRELSLQHRGSAAGFLDPTAGLPDVLLPPGGYFLIGYPKAADAEGTDFTADFERTPSLPVEPGSERFALARVPSALGYAGLSFPSPDEILDLVGVDAATIEGNPTPAYTAQTAAVRKDHGCADTDNNADDFEMLAPEPRSTLTLPKPCPGVIQPDAGPDGGDTDGGVIDPTAGTGLVISQVYGGGGTSGAPFNRDYVEIFNRTAQPVSLAGLSLQYAGASQDFGADAESQIHILPSVMVEAEKYYLVALGSDDASAGANVQGDTSGTLRLDTSHGKIALARTRAPLGCGGAARCPSEAVVDMVGYGAVTDFEGTGATPSLGVSTAALRKGNGCVDTNDNAADFTTGAAAPRNSSRPAVDCSLPPGSTDAGDAGRPNDAGPSTNPSGPSEGGQAGSDSGADGLAPGDGDSGCSCRATGTNASPLAGVLACTAVALVLWRRRRH